MPILSDELIQDVLMWQSKRYIQISAAIDSTKRMIELMESADDDTIDLELDIRQAVLDELKDMDEEFKIITQDMSQDDVSYLLTKDIDDDASPLYKSLQKANRDSFEATSRLVLLDQKFNKAYGGKELSIYLK